MKTTNQLSVISHQSSVRLMSFCTAISGIGIFEVLKRIQHNILFFLTLTFFISDFSFLTVNSQVVINEYCASNFSNITDNFGEYEDWIELYNTSSSPVNLSGYYLSDRITNPTKWQIPAGITIPANGYLHFWCSARNQVIGTNYHTNFKLTQTNPVEYVIFSDPSGNIIDSVNLIPAQKNHSRGRTTDGASTWAVFLTPTPGASNTNPKQEYCAKPVFSVNAGFYSTAQTLTITCSEPGATIRYTLDGSEPTISSTIYSSPINITTTDVLRARAWSTNPNVPPSFIESNTYFINVTHGIAVISIFGDEIEDLMAGGWIEPEVGVEYFDNNLQYKAESTGEANKHGQDSWSFDQRGIDYISRDQLGYNYALLDQMFTYTDRDDFQRIILKAASGDGYPCSWCGAVCCPAHIRDAYVHTLSQRYHLHLDERTYEPCVMYVNGQYWGVYEIREKVDDSDFTGYYYNQDEFDLQFIKTWGGTWAEYGGNQALTDWNNLRNFIETNNMAIQANYDYVDSLLNVKSLADYFLLNSYVVNADWLNWNTGWWRGLNPNGEHKKWGYILWDQDATFGMYTNYTDIPDETANADPCFPEQLPNPGGQGHTTILDKLLENPGFHQYYVSRYADLLNTAFKCENMQSLLDSLLALITPEMPAQIARWGGSLTEWQQNVQCLKNFINQRCATTIDNGLIDCYELNGPYTITIIVEPVGSGNVKVNSLQLSTYPWTGEYFGGIETLLKATPNTGYSFAYWETQNNPVTPSTTDPNISITLTQNDTVIAHFSVGAVMMPTTNTTNVSCYGGNDGTAVVSVIGGTPPYTYLWNTTPPQTNDTATGLSAGSYTVTITDSSGTQASATVTITQPTQLTITTSSTPADCGQPTGTATATAAGGISPYTYSWNITPAQTTQTATGLLAGTYIVTVTDANGCQDSIPVIVNDDSDLMATITNVTNVSCQTCNDGSATVNASGGTPPYTYSWNTTPQQTDATATGLSVGTYTITVQDANNCTYIATVTIIVEPITYNGIYIPQAFSPNNDNNNDVLQVFTGDDVANFDLVIYNRWGEKIFHTNNESVGWDGRFNGKLENSGVYVYKLKVKYTDGKEEIKGGNITLVR